MDVPLKLLLVTTPGDPHTSAEYEKRIMAIIGRRATFGVASGEAEVRAILRERAGDEDTGDETLVLALRTSGPEDFGPDDTLALLRELGRQNRLIVLATKGGGAVSIAEAVRLMKSGASDILPEAEWPARLPGAIRRAVVEAEIAHKRATEESRRWRKADFFRRLAETTPVIPWEADRASLRFEYVGPQAAVRFGYSEKEWTEPGFWEAGLHPDDREIALALVAEMEGEYDVEYRRRTRQGTYVWVHDFVTPGRRTDGRAVLRGFMLDVTPQKRAMEVLKQNQQHLTLLVQRTPLAVIEMDAQAHIVYWNPAAESIFGWSAGEAIGQPHTFIIPESDQPTVDEIIAQLLTNTGGKRSTNRNLTREGKIIFCEWYNSTLLDDDGHPCGIICMAQDVTERMEAEADLRRFNSELEMRVEERTLQLAGVNKELESFCYSVSHDLRSPLRSVDGFSKALLEDYGDRLDEEGLDHLRRIRGASQRMGELIDDLLALSRVSRSELRRGPVDLGPIALAVDRSLRNHDPAREVDFILAPDLRTVGDASLLLVLLENLLSNAWKYTSRHPRARVELGVETGPDGQKIFFVRDDGAGFDPRYSAKLFQPFQRLHHAAEFEGHGIGLATVLRIVNRHGGKVWAEGEIERGATFRFTL